MGEYTCTIGSPRGRRDAGVGGKDSVVFFVGDVLHVSKLDAADAQQEDGHCHAYGGHGHTPNYGCVVGANA